MELAVGEGAGEPLTAWLAGRFPGLQVLGSEAGLYVWMKVEDDLTATANLLDDGIVVSPGRAFGRGGEGYIRLALVPTLDECQEAAEAVVRCLT